MHTVKNWLKWIWSVRSEATLVIIALIGFAHIAGWLRFFDSTAAPLDIGILSAPAVGVVGVIFGVFLFWTLWRVCFPREIDEWFDRDPAESHPLAENSKPSFLDDFLTAPEWVRLGLFFGTLWAVLLSIGLITMALR
jgi:hypothetical protein